MPIKYHNAGTSTHQSFLKVKIVLSSSLQVQKHLAHESLELKRVGILAVISAMQHKASLIVPSARDDDENIRDLENSLDGYTRMVVRHCKTHHSTISLCVFAPFGHTAASTSTRGHSLLHFLNERLVCL